MTTPQIIIISALFILDFYLSVIHNIYKGNNPAMAIGQTIRMGLLYSLLLTFCFVLNDSKEKAKGKCPEYERLENVYKLKIN